MFYVLIVILYYIGVEDTVEAHAFCHLRNIEYYYVFLYKKVV